MKIKEIEKIKLEKDDVLLVTVPEDFSEESQKASGEALKECFPKNKIIFKPESISIKVVAPPTEKEKE